MTCSFKPFNWYRASGHPRNDAVCVHLPSSTKLRILRSAKKINHGNILQ